jgi:trans-aconitate methyltransferase
MIVKPDHFRYLYVQRGEVSDAYKQGFDAWKLAYERSLASIEESIAPALPRSCAEILDVGGGMGGIGVLLSRRYPTAGYRILDGVSDEPEVRSHCKTFSNAVVASDFLSANGVRDFGFYEPFDGFDRKFDLVVSFAAWGFHILPGDYLDRVKSALAPRATVILDVRKHRPDWLSEFAAAFGRPSHVLERGKKHVRIAWQT